jgi:predicted amidohydrolase YtcJ
MRTGNIALEQLAADLVITNGKVITVDSEFTIAESVAVKGDRITVVGTNDDVRPLIGKNTRVLDLRGKTVLPGINDAHIHASLFGATKSAHIIDVGYPTVKSISDIISTVDERTKAVPPGEWIQGFGWDCGYLDECLQDAQRQPTRFDLDPVSSNNPVCLTDISIHNIWVNSIALELAGVTKYTPLPLGGEIVKDPITGEPTGVLKELPAISYVMRLIPPWTRKQKRDAILTAMKELNAVGITSMTEGALGPGGSWYQGGLIDAECISIYNDLYNEGKLTVRTNILLLFGEYGAISLENWEQNLAYLGIHTGFGNEWLRIAGVKLFADGTPPNKTAWMHKDYAGGYNGRLLLPGDTDEERQNELTNVITYAHKHGFQLGIHATGDRSSDACVDALVKIIQEEPRDLRHYIIHGDFISDEYAKRMAKYGIGANVQSGVKWSISDLMDNLVGEKKAARQWPIRTLIDSGVHTVESSDAPCLYPNWKQVLQAAVLRESKGTGKVSGPEQCITVEEGIRLFTIESAWQDHAENIKGSVEVGKLADFCVLEEDILTVDPHRIKDIPTVMTIIGGRIVYDAGTVSIVAGQT